MRGQLQGLQIKMPAKKSSIPKKIKSNTQVAHVEVAEKDLKKLSAASSEKWLECSLCHVKTLENFVFLNKYCKHQYCLCCAQEAGEPSLNQCYLKTCRARLDTFKLKKFLINLQPERKDNQMLEQKKNENKEEIKPEESKIQNIKAEENEAKNCKVEENKIQKVPLKENQQKRSFLWQNIQAFFQLKE